jgi:hypothetical protein
MVSLCAGVEMVVETETGVTAAAVVAVEASVPTAVILQGQL